MILLHGGFTPELISGLVGGFLAALILFIALIIYGVKSRFNREVLSKLATSQKIFTSVFFVLGAAFLSFISFYFFINSLVDTIGFRPGSHSQYNIDE